MPKIKSPITNEKLNLIGEKLLLSSLDDVLSGRGDSDSIRTHASRLARKVYENQPLLENERRAIAYALHRIAKSKRLSFLFEKNSKRKTDKGKEMTIAMRVYYLITNSGFPVLKALEAVGQEMNKTTDAVSKIYYRHIKTIKAEQLKTEKL